MTASDSPKMGILVTEAAAQTPVVLERKRRAG